MIKVLRVISSMNPSSGGPCQGIRNSIPELQKLGIESEVVCLDDPTSSFLQKDDFTIHALGASRSGWAYNSALPKWLKLNFTNYDVVIIHGLWLFHSYITIKTLSRYRNNKNIPAVYLMPHGMLDPWFQKEKTRKLKAVRNEIYWRLIEKNVVNKADGLLFTCEQELLLARNTFPGYKPKNEINVSYGVQSPPEFSIHMNEAFRSKTGTLDGRSYLLFLSRLHKKKGVDILIEAYIKLKNADFNLPDLVIAGPLEGEFAQKIFEQYRGNRNIHFTGMLEDDAKWGAFYSCEAYILPSHQENFGISVVEALACGRPVLISDQVNIYKEIELGGAGLIDNDTKSGVENLLRRWITLTPGEKRVFSEKAKEVYLNNYSIEQTAKILVNVFELSRNHA